MWTIKQNNRFATFIEVVWLVVPAVAGTVAALLGHWLAVLAAGAVVAWTAAGMALGRGRAASRRYCCSAAPATNARRTCSCAPTRRSGRP
jgi:hypothetical protein